MKSLLGSFKLSSTAGISLLFLFFVAHPATSTVYAQSRTLRVVSTNIQRGQQGNVAVEMDALGDENTVGFSLTFNTNQVTFVSVTLGSDVPTNTTLLTNASQTGSGRLGIAISLPIPSALSPGRRQLVLIRFTASQTGVSVADIRLGDVPIAREFVRGNATTIPPASVISVDGVVTIFAAAASTNAASYSTVAMSPESIAAVFGVGLATGTDVGGTIPLPTNLLGTTIKVRDSAGIERLSQLFFVSPTQCNYQIPTGTSIGAATVTITSGDGSISIGAMTVANVNPGIFTANATGLGVPAAQIFRIRGTSQFIESVATFQGSAFVPAPIDFGPPGDVLVLVLYGTGIRFNTGLAGATVTIGGTPVPVGYANVTQGFIGLDQINTGALPRSLAGRGVVNVVVTIDGVSANTTTIRFQ